MKVGTVGRLFILLFGLKVVRLRDGRLNTLSGSMLGFLVLLVFGGMVLLAGPMLI